MLPAHDGAIFLSPLSRLLQRLLLPQSFGAGRRFGLRRYLWLLKRRHQRRRQSSGGGHLPPYLAQLEGFSPLEGRPLEDSPICRLLQHRGPGWWHRATALRGEEAARNLLRSLLLQQQLWLQLRRAKQRRRRRLQRRRGRSIPPAQQEGWKEGLKRILRPLRRSRRRHQLKGQENLGRFYREEELKLLTYRLVAALEPKLQVHQRRAARAHQQNLSPASRLLHWLRGGSLPPQLTGKLRRQRLPRRQLSPLRRQLLRDPHCREVLEQRRHRRQWLKRHQQLYPLRYVRRWLKDRQEKALEAKRRREGEVGRTLLENPGTLFPTAPEEPREKIPNQDAAEEPSTETSTAPSASTAALAPGSTPEAEGAAASQIFPEDQDSSDTNDADDPDDPNDLRLYGDLRDADDDSEELRLEKKDLRKELVGAGRLVNQLRRLELLLQSSPLGRFEHQRFPARKRWRHRRWTAAAEVDRSQEATEQRRLLVEEATLQLLRRPREPQRRRLAAALRRWRRGLLRQRRQQLLQSPLLVQPEQPRRLQLQQRLWNDRVKLQLLRRQGHNRAEGWNNRSGLEYSSPQQPRSLAQLRRRWRQRLLPSKVGFSAIFQPFSREGKKSLFRWTKLLDYWTAGELPEEHRRRRWSPRGRPPVVPKALPEGRQQENRRKLMDYLGLELRLLETQLELREDPALLKPLMRRYLKDGWGRLIYPQPAWLQERRKERDNPFFLPEKEIMALKGRPTPPFPPGTISQQPTSATSSGHRGSRPRGGGGSGGGGFRGGFAGRQRSAAGSAAAQNSVPPSPPRRPAEIAPHRASGGNAGSPTTPIRGPRGKNQKN